MELWEETQLYLIRLPDLVAKNQILGDNIFYSENFSQKVRAVNQHTEGASVFAYPVKNPSAYGIVDFDDRGKAISIEVRMEVAGVASGKSPPFILSLRWPDQDFVHLN